ncbi:hypothetical protein J437_LFUL016715 [Ladona fulva]|uniref:Uncharacterized protein n=1 Tax=Ladona fulva TaxID=123851 RepID=A0A8K0P8M8_LADFU|nr:hypothetical protein J437_LFUL016715 [Ladona fulva]
MMFSPKKQTIKIMELVKQQNHTEAIIIKNTKLLDGLLNQLEDLHTDFKDLEKSIRTYQKTQINYTNDIVSLKKKVEDKNHDSTSEIKMSKESTYIEGEMKAKGKLESISFAQEEVIELFRGKNDFNKISHDTMQLDKPINDKNCSRGQNVCTLKSQLEKFYELSEEVKYFERRQKDLLEEKQVEVKSMINDMISVWSKKSKQLEESVIKLAKSINILKKTQRQNLLEGMKKIKNANLSYLTETINQRLEKHVKDNILDLNKYFLSVPEEIRKHGKRSFSEDEGHFHSKSRLY